MTGLSEYTLRYYERLGLIDDVQRDASGHRRYSNKDVEWLIFLATFREMGMSIQEMLKFAGMKRSGLHAAPDRKAFLEAYRAKLSDEVRDRANVIELIDWKLHILDQKIASGSPEPLEDTFQYLIQWRESHRHR
ncbi:MAG: MerR family transcriptional regulator [Candidatus Saccharibacteria bacterium]|nr:MerR family transcriptional regulator [Candidatus Saccharibacteria bacterium]